MWRVICYLLYYIFVIRLPRSYEFGLIGKVARTLRNRLGRVLISEAPANIFIEKGANFGGGKNLRLKDYACIGENARFMGNGIISIGQHAMMGPDVLIITDDHRMTEDGFNGYVSGKVTIGDYAWIGARTIILKNVTIGEHVVIGAGSVVSKDIPSFSVAAGVPAKVVRTRKIEP